MKTMGAEKFKEQCLALLDRLDAEGLIVTKHGKPVARVLPYDQDCRDLIGSLKHKIEIRDELLKTGVRWNTDALVPEGTPTSPLDVPSVTANISTQEVVSLIRRERGRSRGLKRLD